MRPRQVVEYFGTHPDKMLGLALIPTTETQSGVVICGSLKAEQAAFPDRDRELARALADAGHAVVRFHFRGDGQSAGRIEDLTLQTMIEDVGDAIGWLRDVAGVSALAMSGTRLGGLAAAAAPGTRGAPLAIWEPVFDVEAYFLHLARIKVTEAMGFAPSPESEGGANSLKDQVAKDLFEEELATVGFFDCLGLPIGVAFYQSTVHRHLADELEASARPILLSYEADADRHRFEAAVNWINRQLQPSESAK